MSHTQQAMEDTFVDAFREEFAAQFAEETYELYSALVTLVEKYHLWDQGRYYLPSGVWINRDEAL